MSSDESRVIDLRTAEYWDIRDIQFHCKVSRSTAWRMADEPDFPARITYGRCVRWPRAEVVEFLERRRDAPHVIESRPTHRPAPSTFTTRAVRRRSA